MSQATESCPARPQRLIASFGRSGDQLRLCCRNGIRGAGAFLLLWLIGWTVGCVFLAGMVLKDPKPFNFLFAIPFWVSWIFVFCLLLKMFFQREELLLDREGAAYVQKVFVTLKQRRVPLAEIQSFERFATVVESYSGRQESGIEMRTLGQPIRIAQGRVPAELDWLQFQLNEHLGALRENLQRAVGEAGRRGGR